MKDIIQLLTAALFWWPFAAKAIKAQSRRPLPRAVLSPKKFWRPWPVPALRGVKIVTYDHEKIDFWCMSIPDCGCAACACQCSFCRSLGKHSKELCEVIPGA